MLQHRVDFTSCPFLKCLPRMANGKATRFELKGKAKQGMVPTVPDGFGCPFNLSFALLAAYMKVNMKKCF
ncbi:uncharacterized protein G2W53_026400 [Senna tora]|uniref:Uncharacterized protein n=1 Tax=Senna tora TaxID=362788 RepID=A0A834THE1_9FABA|nr:uncharacterized protein G2W53_026400 [Senna tora]